MMAQSIAGGRACFRVPEALSSQTIVMTFVVQVQCRFNNQSNYFTTFHDSSVVVTFHDLPYDHQEW